MLEAMNARAIRGPEPVGSWRLVGAIDVILECEEMLAGRRKRFTTAVEFGQQRQAYWEARLLAASRPRPVRKAS